ncbi:MAG: DUF3795 domain-containing protein [Thermodesulfobacteriota bacterium]
MINQALLSPCGLYCGVCGIYVAHREGNEKFKEKLAPVYGCTPEEIACDGCLGTTRFKYCQTCPIRSCAEGKSYEGCHQCNDFPCQFIENFPVEVGKQVIMRAIPYRRSVGTEKWVEDEEKRYSCPECGNQLFRGAKRCRSCKTAVNLD